MTDRYCIICGPMGGVDALLNLLLFMPLGLGLALAGVRVSRAVAGMVLFTLAVEVLQLSAVAGRDASIGDLLMNSLGGAAGHQLGARARALLRPHPRAAAALSVVMAAAFLLIQLMAGYSVVPAPTTSTYFGQIAQPFGPQPERFSGTVVRAAVVTQPPIEIPAGRFLNPATVRERLGHASGFGLEATVVGGDSVGYAPIVRIVDDEQRELAVMAQSRRDLVIGVRTGADVLRMRPVRFRVRDVFGAAAGVDTLRIYVKVAGGRANVAITGESTMLHTRHRFVSAAWRLLYPWQTQDSATFGALTGVLWLALLVFPAAFYFRLATPTGARRWLLEPAHLVVMAGASWLVLAPFPTRLVWWEWLALLGGHLAGWGAAGVARAQTPSRVTLSS